MSRLTDNDKKLWFITYGRTNFNAFRLVWSSGDDEDTGNTITGYLFGWVAQVRFATILRPFKVKQIATSWDDETVARIGRNWYFNTFQRDYGFSIHEGFFQVFLGAQTHDSKTTQSWARFLPWTQWRFIRKSLYDLEGNHFWTEPTKKQVPNGKAWDDQETMRRAVPKALFEFLDYDGKRITAKTHIEEWEWRFGEGWFKWLSLFNKPKIRRTLDIEFSEEIGPDKGSWKGGTIGHSIQMLQGELHESAFMRYCEQEQTSRNKPYKLKFIGIKLENTKP